MWNLIPINCITLVLNWNISGETQASGFHISSTVKFAGRKAHECQFLLIGLFNIIASCRKWNIKPVNGYIETTANILNQSDSATELITGELNNNFPPKYKLDIYTEVGGKFC